MSQLTTSMVNWLEDISAEKLIKLELILKRVRAVKGLISQKEKEIKSLDELFIGSLYAVMGKSRQKIKEEKRQEITMLHNLLGKLQNNRKVHLHLRNISKFDTPSLRNVGRTIAAIVDKKITFENPFLRNFTMTPAERDEYERKKNGERQRRNREEEEKKQRREARKARIDIEKRVEKHDLLQSKGVEFMEYLYQGEDVRLSDIPFTEPVQGCKYNIGHGLGNVIIPLREQILRDFLLKSYEYLLNVAEQLYDGIGKRISLNLLTVSQWSRIIQENSEEYEDIEIHTHNTKFRSFMSRNQIKEKCDEVIKMLMDKMMMPQSKSGLSFKEGILIRIEYYANLSNEMKTRSRKNREGQWVDHKTISCFTAKVRTEDIKAMDNYTVKKPTYIYNIKNTNDDLCFIRYMIVVKFLSKLKKCPYLIHDNPKDKFKDYYTSHHLPQVNPENLGVMDHFFPFICYPDKEINSRV